MSLLLESLNSGIHAIPVTLILIIVPFVVGSLLSLIVVYIRYCDLKILSGIITVILTIQRGIPIYLFIIGSHIIYLHYGDSVFAFFGLPWHVRDLNIIYFAALIISIAFVPILTETYWGAVLAIGNGQIEAGFTAGLTKFQIFRRVVFPQMMLEALPNLSNRVIELMKASALTYFVGVLDVMNASLQPAIRTMDYLPSYIATAAIFWAMSIVLEQIMHLLEKHVGTYKATVAYAS